MGTGSHGQSIATTMSQIVADEMGVNFEDVTFVQGDTASTPYGPNTGGSKTAGIAGGAAHEAGATMRERVLAVAGLMLEIDPGDLEMTGSTARIKGDPEGKSVTLAQIASAAISPGVLPPGSELGLEISRRYQAPQFMFSNACHAVTVEVDRDTGMVKILRYVISEDCGVMINPNVVEGQTAGGVVQGIGGVFYEHFRYDEAGNPTTTTFMDYLLPTAAEVPGPGVRPHRDPGADPGRPQGPGRGRRDWLPGRAGERGPRRAGPAWRLDHLAAAHAGPDPGPHRDAGPGSRPRRWPLSALSSSLTGRAWTVGRVP